MSQPNILESHAAGLRASVIVPVYNGVQTIIACLDALSRQSLPPKQYEILVVDDGSTDETAKMVRIWMKRHPQYSVRLVQQQNTGPAAARNRGAQVAKADILLFTDADCAPTATWCAALLHAFDKADVVGAKGTYLTVQTGSVSRFVQAEYEDRYDRMDIQNRINFVDTYSAGYRRQVFLENGGFDSIFSGPTASNEDQELSFRLAAKGYRLVFVPNAQVQHVHDRTVKEYFKRKYQVGFWKALILRWHPERMIQDSHTPQSLKVQILLFGLLCGLLPLAILAARWPLLRFSWPGVPLVLLLFYAVTGPFLWKLTRLSLQLLAASIILLPVRALALGAGYVMGTIYFAGTPAGHIQPVMPGWQRLTKRGIDIIGALVGIALFTPLILIAAVAIKLDSPGPVFHKQRRIGEHGAPFHIVKLRSMKEDAEERLAELVDLSSLPEPSYKISNDPRVTRIGHFLRRSSLDEVPQFWNVLRGEMSLVGPRPENEQIVALYNDQQRRRLQLKPGMTGPMQVNGRGDLPMCKRLQLELEYIENYSLWTDLYILLRTVPSIWHGRGAY